MRRSQLLWIVFDLLFITVTLMGILVFTGGDAAYAEPRSYPMTCRGGGRLVIANDGDNGVRISFEAGSGAVYDGIQPGQCTWSDRPLHPNEPKTLCDRDRDRAATYVGALVQPDHTVIFQVYNDGQGCMIMTRVGL